MHLNKSRTRIYMTGFIHILPLFFWIFIIFGFDNEHTAAITLAAALIHEGGHIMAMNIIGKSYRIQCNLSGFRIKMSQTVSYIEEITVALGGPLINLIFAFFFLFASKKNGYTYLFGVINLFTAISNLFPIEGLDGYRIIEALLLLRSPYGNCQLVLQRISFLFVCIFLFISLYLMQRIDGGYWIFIIFLSFAIKSIKNNERIILREKGRKAEKNRAFKS